MKLHIYVDSQIQPDWFLMDNPVKAAKSNVC